MSEESRANEVLKVLSAAIKEAYEYAITDTVDNDSVKKGVKNKFEIDDLYSWQDIVYGAIRVANCSETAVKKLKQEVEKIFDDEIKKRALNEKKYFDTVVEFKSNYKIACEAYSKGDIETVGKFFSLYI